MLSDVLSKVLTTRLLEKDGLTSSIKAAAALTMGAAIDVPDQ